MEQYQLIWNPSWFYIIVHFECCNFLVHSRTLQRTMKKQGLVFKMNTKVTEAVKQEGGGVKVTMEAVKGGKVEELEGDVLLVCIGRRAYADGLGLEVSGRD